MIATNLEQSKHLIELGLNPRSADMWWLYITSAGKHILHAHDEPDPHYMARMESYGFSDFAIPSWSLSALEELTKVCTRCECNLRVDKRWNVFATCGDFVYRGFDMNPKGDESPLDGIYKLVVWLLENKCL